MNFEKLNLTMATEEKTKLSYSFHRRETLSSWHVSLRFQFEILGG